MTLDKKGSRPSSARPVSPDSADPAPLSVAEALADLVGVLAEASSLAIVTSELDGLRNTPVRRFWSGGWAHEHRRSLAFDRAVAALARRDAEGVTPTPDNQENR